jgi:hypothetical protein
MNFAKCVGMRLPLVVGAALDLLAKDMRYDKEGTGDGWKTEAQLDSYFSAQPTFCQMKGPSR